MGLCHSSGNAGRAALERDDDAAGHRDVVSIDSEFRSADGVVYDMGGGFSDGWL